MTLIPAGEVAPGAALDIELIKCGATPSTGLTRSEVMTHSDELAALATPKEIAFSVPTESKGKYLLRLSNKAQAPGVGLSNR